MNVRYVPPPNYLSHLPNGSRLAVIGEPTLIDSVQLALFCSVKCPASIILKAHDLAQKLKAERTGVIGGFHSPVEKEMLVTLLRGDAPIIVCPARSIDNMRVPANWKPHIEQGRMLIISPFSENQKRSTQQTAMRRNQFVAALAQRVFVAYAAPGGKTEAFARDLITMGKSICTFDDTHTLSLQDIGADTL